MVFAFESALRFLMKNPGLTPKVKNPVHLNLNRVFYFNYSSLSAHFINKPLDSPACNIGYQIHNRHNDQRQECSECQAENHRP